MTSNTFTCAARDVLKLRVEVCPKVKGLSICPKVRIFTSQIYFHKRLNILVILDEVLYFTILYPLQILQLSACAHSNFMASTMCPVFQAVPIHIMSLQHSYVNII